MANLLLLIDACFNPVPPPSLQFRVDIWECFQLDYDVDPTGALSASRLPEPQYRELWSQEPGDGAGSSAVLCSFELLLIEETEKVQTGIFGRKKSAAPLESKVKQVHHPVLFPAYFGVLIVLGACDFKLYTFRMSLS